MVVDGKPFVVANRGGYRTTPSVVALAENGRRLVGHIAKRQAVTNAENTAHSVKRLIGRAWGSAAVKAVRDLGPYRLIEGPHQDVRVQLRDQTFSIPEISAFVLQEMKLVAERHLGAGRHTRRSSPCRRTSPTTSARPPRTPAASPGLEVMRVINEPTAAALAYGFGRKVDGRIAVYDLGGGTFDVAILEVSNGVFEVLASAGDTFLGGEDFDRRIIDWLVSGFARDQKVNLRRDPMAMQRLKDAAERAKCELSQPARDRDQSALHHLDRSQPIVALATGAQPAEAGRVDRGPGRTHGGHRARWRWTKPASRPTRSWRSCWSAA